MNLYTLMSPSFMSLNVILPLIQYSGVNAKFLRKLPLLPLQSHPISTSKTSTSTTNNEGEENSTMHARGDLCQAAAICVLACCHRADISFCCARPWDIDAQLEVQILRRRQ